MKAFFVHDVSQLFIIRPFCRPGTMMLIYIAALNILPQLISCHWSRFYLLTNIFDRFVLSFLPASAKRTSFCALFTIISFPPTLSVIVIMKPTAITQCSSFPTKRWWNDTEDADAADAAADDCNGRLVSALSQLGPPPRARDLGKLQPRPDDALTAHE